MDADDGSATKDDPNEVTPSYTNVSAIFAVRVPDGHKYGILRVIFLLLILLLMRKMRKL